MTAYILFCLFFAWLAYHTLPKGLMPQLADGLTFDDGNKDERKPWEEFLLFKKGGGSAPAPDPRIGEAAMKNAETGEDWLDFARDQFGVANERQKEIDELTGQLVDRQLDTIDKSNQWAQEDRDIQQGYREKYDQWADEDRATGQEYRDQFAEIGRDALDQAGKYQDRFDQAAGEQMDFAREQQDRYRDTFQPLEDQFAADAAGWDSPERQAKQAAEARADVLSSAQASQQQQNRQMAAMGIDPRSGRRAGVDAASNLTTSLAAAGAQNQARDNVRQQGVAMRGAAIDMGRGAQAMGQQAAGLGLQATGAGHTAATQGQQMNLQANNLGLAASGVGNTAAQLGMGNQGAGYQGLGTGINAGNSAMGMQLGAHSAFGQNQNIMGQGFQGAMSGYTGQANALNNLYNSQLNAWSAQQQANAQSSAGLFGGIGSLLGTGIGAYSALSSKKAKEKKRPAKGALKAVESMPVEKWKYKDGMADGGEHIGPYAEDFKKATGLGDGRTINLVDAIGLNMKATQELSDKVNKLAGGRKATAKTA